MIHWSADNQATGDGHEAIVAAGVVHPHVVCGLFELQPEILVEIVCAARNDAVVRGGVLDRQHGAVWLNSLDRGLRSQVTISSKNVPARRGVRVGEFLLCLGRQAKRESGENHHAQDPAHRFQNMRVHALILRIQAETQGSVITCAASNSKCSLHMFATGQHYGTNKRTIAGKPESTFSQ